MAGELFRFLLSNKTLLINESTSNVRCGFSKVPKRLRNMSGGDCSAIFLPFCELQQVLGLSAVSHVLIETTQTSISKCVLSVALLLFLHLQTILSYWLLFFTLCYYVLFVSLSYFFFFLPPYLSQEIVAFCFITQTGTFPGYVQLCS